MQDQFIKLQEDSYNTGVTLQEYKGCYYLVASKEGRDGKVYHDWAFPQTKDRTPGEKAWPVKVKLGNSEQEAIQTLRMLAAFLKPGLSSAKPRVAQEVVEDDIPF